jgi:hypothetical protein
MEKPWAHINYAQLGQRAVGVVELYLHMTLGYSIGWGAAKDQANHMYNSSRLVAGHLLAAAAKFLPAFRCSA